MELSKHTLRQALRSERDALSQGFVRAAGAAVLARLRAFPPFLAATHVLGYAAKDNEVPIDDVMRHAYAAGRQVYLPRAGLMEFVRHVPGERLGRSAWGVLEPPGRSEVFRSPTPAALALVPLMAWDASGARLGRGAGWYDRVLSRLGPGLVTVGVGYELQRRGRLPAVATDVALDFVITERRLVCCRRNGGTGAAERRNA